MPAAQYRHHNCRITDDLLYRGYRTLFLENELIRVGVLLDKGADIFQFIHKPSDTDFLWRSPWGLLRRERFQATRPPSIGSFLDTYHGGWQEILPGGGPLDYQGAELGIHGEVTLLGWECDILEDSPQRISVKLLVDCVRTPLRLERVMTLESGAPNLYITETLTNLSPAPVDYMWGHHPAFGAPFLRDGVRIFLPAGQAQVHAPQFLPSSRLEPGLVFEWPLATRPDRPPLDVSQVAGPQEQFAEMIYLSQLRAGWYAVLDPQKQVGFGLAWDHKIMPYVWFWLVYGAAPGYPWWDRVYVMALEPWTTIPNKLDQAIGQGTAAHLKGGEVITFACTATAIAGREQVRHIDLQGNIQ
jgi:galactose mutarotase-like enzyme